MPLVSDADVLYQRRQAYQLVAEPLFAEGDPMTPARLQLLRQLLERGGQEQVLVKIFPDKRAAALAASDLRDDLGPDCIVSVDLHGLVYARERRLREPMRHHLKVKIDKSQWVTREAAARFLGVTLHGLLLITRRGELQRVPFGHRYLYRREDVEELHRKRQRAAAGRPSRT